MVVLIDSHTPADYVVIEASEIIYRHEADQVRQAVVTHVQQHGELRLLVCLDANLVGLDPDADWTYDTFEDEWLQRQVKQIAIVGDPKWQDHALMFFLSGIVPAPIKFFPTEQESLARAWLGDQRYLVSNP
jgi:hypothetical protein